MGNKYKVEVWHKTLWRGTQRETITTTEKLVMRGKNGQFIKGKPVIQEIKEKTYPSGVYKVGVVKGKIVTRYKISGRETPEWKKTRQETLQHANIYRCSLALNDIPYKGSDYYGFRIIAFSRNKKQLEAIYPQKMYRRLISFISSCLHYKSDEFWFMHYLNYMGKIPPEISNASIRESGKYELLWTKRKTGSIMKQDSGNIGDL